MNLPLVQEGFILKIGNCFYNSKRGIAILHDSIVDAEIFTDLISLIKQRDRLQEYYSTKLEITRIKVIYELSSEQNLGS